MTDEQPVIGPATGVEVQPGTPETDPTAVLTSVGQALADIPANATSTQMRSALRTLGETITAALTPETRP